MSSRRRSSQPIVRSRTRDQAPAPPKQLAQLVALLQETVDELKADVLMLTRKIVSLEAELDYVQGRRGL